MWGQRSFYIYLLMAIVLEELKKLTLEFRGLSDEDPDEDAGLSDDVDEEDEDEEDTTEGKEGGTDDVEEE